MATRDDDDDSASEEEYVGNGLFLRRRNGVWSPEWNYDVDEWDNYDVSDFSDDDDDDDDDDYDDDDDDVDDDDDDESVENAMDDLQESEDIANEEWLEKKRATDEEEESDTVGHMIEVGDLHRLGSILDQDPRAKVTVRRTNGAATNTYTPLAYAVHKSRVEAVAFLLERGASVNTRSTTGVSVLGEACNDGCPEIAELLVSRGAKLNLDDDKDLVLIHDAFDCKRTKFLECIFTRGAVEFDRKSENANDKLLRSCELPSLKLVKYFLGRGLDVNKCRSDNLGNQVTPLSHACVLGEVAIARELVERGAKIDLRNPESDRTAIMHACAQDAESASVVKAIKYLIDRGANVDAMSREDGSTALMLASQKGHSWVVRCLLDAGAKVNLQNKEGRTALMLACAYFRGEVVDLLLRAGAQTGVQDQDGQTALIAACARPPHAASGDHMGIVELLADSGANLDAQDTQGATALICASQSGHLKVVQDLLARGAKVDLRAKHGQTALMRCCDYADAEAFTLLHRESAGLIDSSFIKASMQRQEIARGRIVFELLQHGAQVNLQDACGSSPLMLACREYTHKYWEQLTLLSPDNDVPAPPRQCRRSDGARSTIVRELLQRGADANLQDQHGYTALMHAVFRGKAEVVRLLCAHGAALDLRDCKGATALMKSIQYKKNLPISLLLDGLASADSLASVDLQDNDGTTALMLAAKDDNYDAAELLVTMRAATNVQDNDGKSALMWAAQCAEAKLCQLLIKFGAKADLRSKDGSTALMAATGRGDIGCMDCLLAAHAEVAAQRDDGMTALMLAVKSSLHDAVEMLGKRRATLDQQNEKSMTALMLAVAKGDARATKILLDAGAALDTQSTDGATALILATRRTDPELVKLLLERDTISLDVQQEDGTTALMVACAKGAFGVADLLIRAGANVNIRDTRGRAALRMLANHHAKAWGTGKLLVDRGAELDLFHVASANARAALAVACRQGYMEVLELLGDEYYTRPSSAGGAGGRTGATARKSRKSRKRRKGRK